MTLSYLPDVTTELCLTSGAFDFEASDSFARADASDTLGVAESLQTWVNDVGTAGIAGNKAYFPVLSGGAAHSSLRCLAGGDVGVTLSTIATGCGVKFRQQDASNYWRAVAGASAWNVYCVEDDVATLVASPAGATVDGTAIKVRAEGSTIRAYVNGVPIGSPITDSTFASSPDAGLYAESSAARFDDFSAAFVWTDISGYVREVPVIQRGRQHELDQMETGTADVKLSNTDRRFDPAFTGSPYYPYLLPLRRIRLTATWAAVTYPLFVGHVERWPLEYNKPATDGTVTVTAVDRLAVIGSGLWDVYPDTVLGMQPDAYWRMGVA